SENGCKQRNDITVLAQQRIEARAAMQSVEEAIECNQRGVGILSLSQLLQQHRHELSEMSARERSPEGAIFATKPTRDGTEGFHWLPETERPNPIDGHTHVARVNRKRCLRTRRGQRGFKQIGIMSLHDVQMRE